MSEQFTCARCCMDRTASEIEFTETGCNFCDLALAMEPKDAPLPDLRSDGEYDVLIGLSGGVDSSYLLHTVVEMGLRPLCYSVDNGWNNALADENIMKLVEGLKVPFFRYVLDLKEFVRLQSAFITAGVKNLEIPTDHVLMATSYEVAAVYGIKNIVSGGNWSTESIMPPSWGYNARDLTHIKDINRKHGQANLSKLPTCGLLKFNYYRWVKGITVTNLLDYLDYNRNDAVKELNAKYGFVDYHEKHCENYFTWWFQNFYLYEKWGIDKRKAHLSSLVVSGQMTRAEAMTELEKNPVYPTLGMERRALASPKREHEEFKKDEKLFNFIGRVIKRYVLTQ